MRLALALGFPTTRAMFKVLSWDDFIEWWEYDKVEPIGGTRDDYLAASICTSVMNGIAVLARSRKRFKIKDFLLEWGKEATLIDQDGKTLPTGQPWQQMKMVAKMWATLANADEDAKKVKGGRRPNRKAQAEAAKTVQIQAVRDLMAASRKPKK